MMITPSLTWLDDPEVFRVNKLPAHSDHRWFENAEAVKTGTSSFERSLDGEWEFDFVQSAKDFDAGFALPDHGPLPHLIPVPKHIELAGYAQNQYINTMYPWDGRHFRRPPYTLGQTQLVKGLFSQAEDNPVGLYRKTFTVPEAWAGLSVRIHFGGVEEAMYLWLNGHFIGYSEDSFAPAEFDLTAALQAGPNVLAVAVFKRSTAAFIEDQDMFRFSGIFRSVTLLATPAGHVEDIALSPQVTADGAGVLTATIKLFEPAGAASVRLTVQEPSGAVIATRTAAAKPQVTFTIPVGAPALWAPGQPALYTITAEPLNQDGSALEVAVAECGFRTLTVADNVVSLNGQRLILTGVNRHEWSAQTGRAITRADMVRDIATFKANHINAVRTCHYMDQLAWYRLCDQAGIIVMAECNLESHGSWQKMSAVEPSYNVPGDLPQWQAVVMDRAQSNYETLKNHPAILFWSLGNESYAGADIAAMNAYFKRVDPLRLTHYEGVSQNRALEGQISDLESRMYLPPAGVEDYLQHASKPFVLCEYMHDMGNSCGGMGSYMALLKKYPNFLGGFIWDYIDQALEVSDPVTGQPVMQYGGDFDEHCTDYEFSADGLVFADRTPKPALQEVRYYYGQFTN